jgi:hypothetical protein
MDQLTGYIQYFGAVFYLLTIFSLIGFSSLVIVRSHQKISAVELLLLAPVVGVSILTVPMTILASYEIGISSIWVWSFIACVVSVALVTTFVKREYGQVRSSLIQAGKRLHFWGIGIVVGFIPYFALMMQSGFPMGFGTSATWVNNDLGAYIQVATNIGLSGVADAGLVNGWNAGFQASFDHPGSHALFASISRLLHREPYQVGIVLIATIMTVMFLSSIAVIGRLAKREVSPPLMIAAMFVVINPPLIAAVSNFFFPHLASICLSIGFLALLLIFNETEASRGGFLILGCLTTATMLISVEISLVMMSLVSLFVLSRKTAISRSSLIIRLIVGHLSVLGIGLALQFSLFKSQFDVMTRISDAGVVGWRSNFVSPSMLFGLVPTQFGGPYSAGVRFWDLLFVLGLLVLLAILTYKKKIDLTISLSIFVLCCFVTVGVQKWGVDGYQTWKLVTTFTPFFMIMLLIILLLLTTSARTSGPWLLIPLITVGATFSWSGLIWKDPVSSYVTRDLAQITQSVEIRRQTAVNVLIEPYFKTMAASVMSGVPSRMASPTYQFVEGQELLYRCTLATDETLKTIENHGPIVARRGQYVLVGTPTCD